MITVEDYNTALLNYDKDFIYTIDTNGMEAEKSYLYDFVTVEVEEATYGGAPCMQYSFKFKTDLWDGNYYLTNSEGGLSSSLSISYENLNGYHILTIKAVQNIKLHLNMELGATFTTPNAPMTAIVNFDDRVFFYNDTKRTYKFIVTPLGNYERTCELKLTTTTGSVITLNPTSMESKNNKIIVKFEYTPQDNVQLKDDGVHFIIHQGREIHGNR